jgi:hypothetical protein
VTDPYLDDLYWLERERAREEKRLPHAVALARLWHEKTGEPLVLPLVPLKPEPWWAIVALVRRPPPAHLSARVVRRMRS